MKKQKILVTCALPYANGPLHAGHIRSTYLPADIYVRYLRLKGEDVAFICGSDEHGTPITLTAEKEKSTPLEVATKYHRIMKAELKNLGINFDIFSRTSNKLNHKNAQEFFLTAYEKGYIFAQDVDQYYCSKDKRFLPDRYVEGNCPNCGFEGARGDHCEKCAQALRTLDNPHCIICGSTPELKSTKHWFFKLTEFKEQLRNFLNRKELPANVKNYALNWTENLQNWAITRDLEWGVKVPLKEAKNKVLYVWWDAPIGYISATQEWDKKNGLSYWKNGKIIHFIGKDIIYHHALFWPAMLMAHGKYKLPWTIIAGEYLTLEKQKMSTSRGWVVWISDFLKKYPADYLRYYLTITSPLATDMDFSWKEFSIRINNELSDVLGNFVHRTLTFIQRFFYKEIPKPGEFDEKDKKVLGLIAETQKVVSEKIEQFNFLDGLKAVMDLTRAGNVYLNEKEPWKNKDTQATTIYVAANLVHSIAILLLPFLPETALKIRSQLGHKGTLKDLKWKNANEKIKPGQKIAPGIKPIVQKIEVKAE